MHIQKRGNNYNYRRRVPVKLQSLLQIKEYRRALAPDKEDARMLATTYDTTFNQILIHLKLGAVDKIPELLKILGLNQQEKVIKHDSVYISFLRNKENIAPSSYREYKQQLALFEVLLPSNLRTLSYPHLDIIKDVLSKLPKRNIQKFRDMDLQKLVKAKTSIKERISTKSQNEYLKTLRALIKFAVQRNYMDKEVEVTLFKNKTSARNQRQTLTKSEMYEKKLNALQDFSVR